MSLQWLTNKIVKQQQPNNNQTHFPMCFLSMNIEMTLMLLLVICFWGQQCLQAVNDKLLRIVLLLSSLIEANLLGTLQNNVPQTQSIALVWSRDHKSLEMAQTRTHCGNCFKAQSLMLGLHELAKRSCAENSFHQCTTCHDLDQVVPS